MGRLKDQVDGKLGDRETGSKGQMAKAEVHAEAQLGGRPHRYGLPPVKELAWLVLGMSPSLPLPD